METKRYSLQQIDNLLTFLLNNARSTSKANKVGEESNKLAIEDGVTLDTINGVSIQYSVEYDNDLIYIFKKSGNRNKGYSYRIKDEELDVWEKLRREVRYKFKRSANIDQVLNGEIKYETNEGNRGNTLETDVVKAEVQKEEYPRSDRDADGKSTIINNKPPRVF